MSTRMPRSKRSSKPSKRVSKKQGTSSKTSQGTRTASLFSQGLKSGYSTEQLCMDLLHADTEEEVIRLLADHGYWDNPNVWRVFGNKGDNFSIIGNQSSSAEGALVEKLVNSVDAVLMGECLSAGIQPNSAHAPQSISEAVAQFFFDDRSRANTLGHISHWPIRMRRDLSSRITLAATGGNQNPSFTVVDAGEGQTPDSMPDTLLSLDKQNKVDVHFVQGKFNMGGTGALRFCGTNNLQLVISRRNPAIQSNGMAEPASTQWGFTVVRRENPTRSKRVSTYTYLAPQPNGSVLRLDSDVLPLFPQGNSAYARDAAWGTAIKLYEYKLKGRSNIIRRDGLLNKIDILLPGVALPIRLHECRNYRGHYGSFDTTLTGLGVRLSEDRSENLEPGFPTSSAFTIREQPMTAEVYAFKRGKAATYRNDEGVIFAVNGQTHGNLPKRFFSRKFVGMNSLEDSIFVVVDCTHVDGRTREDLFMNSRDRMEQGEFLRAIEDELASIIKDNQLLRELREQRRREDVEAKLQDSKPFQHILASIIRKSPSLAHLLGQVGPLSDPFKSRRVNQTKAFMGETHPSFFHFKDMDYGNELLRTTATNFRSRIMFETDVVNDYFTRGEYPGKYELRSRDDGLQLTGLPDHNLNLNNGVATLNLALPSSAKIGDIYKYQLVVDDDTIVEPFVNQFVVSVGPYQEPSGGDSRPRHQPDERNNSNGDEPQGLAIPVPTLVYEPDWDRYGFDRESALKAEYHPTDDDGDAGSYEYFINMDNIHLKTELKGTKENPEIVKSRWKFGMVLVAMALLNQSDRKLENDDVPTPTEDVFRITATIAPVLLPLIEHLGGLSLEDIGSDS